MNGHALLSIWSLKFFVDEKLYRDGFYLLKFEYFRTETKIDIRAEDEADKSYKDIDNFAYHKNGIQHIRNCYIIYFQQKETKNECNNCRIKDFKRKS